MIRWFLVLAFLCGGAAHAQDPVVRLKLSTWIPPAHYVNVALKDWAAAIEKESSGSIKSTMFMAEQLGKAFDHYDMARDGIADLALVNPGYQPGRFPIVAAGELPFLIGNGKGGSAAVDAWYRQYAPQEMKDLHERLAIALEPGTWSGRKRIVLPEDVRGLKVRPANATIGNFVTLLGGTNVQASAPEAREILERGVADEVTFTLGSLVLFGMDKVRKYHPDMPFYSVTMVWVMNKGKYDSLSAAQRAVIDRHCNPEWAEKIGSPFADFEQAGRVKLAAMSGHEVYKLTPEQIAAWRKAAEPLKTQWASHVKDADAVYAGLVAELKQRGALAE
jgi:TRAP-type C4-dicarboxylate transport system substrate-binding protein